MKNTLLLVLAFFILAGCTAQSSVTAVPAPGTSPMITSSTKPVSPVLTPTITLVPTNTQEPTATLDPMYATEAAALDSCRGNDQDSIFKFMSRPYSSNKFWSATVCQDDGIYTKVTELGKDTIWKIGALDTDKTTPGVDWFWEPSLWSVDGKYLYLMPRYLGFIDSPWLIYSNGYGLAQLDLSTGVLSTWLEPDFDGHNFALSEDGRLFASSSDIPGTINIRDIKTGQDQTLNFKEKYNILEIRWTPDGARLVVFTEERAEDPAEGGFSIFVYDFQSDELQKLVDKNNLSSIYSPDEFEEPRIYISDLSNEVLSLSDTYQEGYFELDLESGELTQTDDLGTPIAVP